MLKALAPVSLVTWQYYKFQTARKINWSRGPDHLGGTAKSGVLKRIRNQCLSVGTNSNIELILSYESKYVQERRHLAEYMSTKIV